jgi:branched-chain amino acid transport system substrate-binding protein
MCAQRVAAALTAAPGTDPIYGPGSVEDSVRIGVILQLTGPNNSDGKQIEAALRLYMRQHGDVAGGRKIELIVKDDAGIPENSKRIAQELIGHGGVSFICVGLTASAIAVEPIATAEKIPEIVMISAMSMLTERSPYIVRTSFTMAQSSVTLAAWAASNGCKKIVTLVADWPPGVEAEISFKQEFTRRGGEIVDSIRVPYSIFSGAEFGTVLQKLSDKTPDTIYAMVPSMQAAAFARQYGESGLACSGIRLIGPGDMTDDGSLPNMGDAMIGVVTALNYAAAHPSELNKAYVAEFKRLAGFPPNFISVGGYDGMQLIYKALNSTSGSTDGDLLVAAMKGMRWESPRGPIEIDPCTRDIVQNIYLRRVEKTDGELQNIEFATISAVQDPIKAVMQR